LSLFLTIGCESNKNQVNVPDEPKAELGDINMNGLAYEIADAILYSNYFIYGKQVFSVDQQAQVVASDINEDGNTLTISDLVYLMSIVTGNSLPFRKWDSVLVQIDVDAFGRMRIRNDIRIGAAFVIVKGQTTPILLADNMDMIWTTDDLETRVLIWSRDGQCFTDNFLEISGELVSLELATIEGRPVMFDNFENGLFTLYQNIPNPFILETSIIFATKYGLEAKIVITNTDGKIVFQSIQYPSAGCNSIIWIAEDENGRNLPGGIYSCTLEFYNKKETIKMIKLGPT
jgi:hypothetical protein